MKSTSTETDDAGDQTELSNSEKNLIWLNRARGIMIGQYATDELVEIYGLKLQLLSGRSGYCDIFYEKPTSTGENPKFHFIDTININQFSTARQILQHLIRYFPEDQDPPEEPSADDDQIHSPAFH